MGRIGLVHLEAITKAPGVTPVMISNPTISKAEAAAKQYNIPRFTNDAMEVITDPEGAVKYLFLLFIFSGLYLPCRKFTDISTCIHYEQSMLYGSVVPVRFMQNKLRHVQRIRSMFFAKNQSRQN